MAYESQKVLITCSALNCDHSEAGGRRSKMKVITYCCC